MQIGTYTLHIIDSGLFSLDGGAMFGVIPKVLWQKSNPPDELNRINLATRNLLLANGSRKILIDTGMGWKWDEKSAGMYNVRQQHSALLPSLQAIGVAPDDVTDVLLTHLHFDHTGGSTQLSGGRLQPTFPNARYYAQESNFNWAVQPTERDRGSYVQENFMPLLEAGVLSLIPDTQQFFADGIELLRFNGHTFGQQLPLITDGTTSLFYCADLFPTSAHVPLPYIMGYDLQPLITLQEKKQLLPRAVDENWLLFFEHDPLHALGNVQVTAKGFLATGLRNAF